MLLIGDIIIASVKEATPGGVVKKGEVVKAVVVSDQEEGKPKAGRFLHQISVRERCRCIINDQM